MRDIDPDKAEVARIIRGAVQMAWDGAMPSKSALITRIRYKDRLFLVSVSEPGSHPRKPKVKQRLGEVTTVISVAEDCNSITRTSEWHGDSDA